MSEHWVAVGTAVTRRPPHRPCSRHYRTRFAGVAVALLATLVLKVAMGRSRIYPPFLQDQIYGFRLFARSKDWMAFPSATMAGISAFIVGVGPHGRFQRAAAALILITFVVALVVTGSHWLSNIIGGTYLGMVTGAAAARRLRRDKAIAA